MHIGINARRDNSGKWGDMAYAQALATALGHLGHETRIFYRGETPALRGYEDVVIRIVGPYLDEPVIGVPNLLWMISPPNISPLDRLRRFQKIFFASNPLAQFYGRIGLAAAYLPQATDLDIFDPARATDTSQRFDVVFVGNRAPRVSRQNIVDAIEMGFDVKVWGIGWDGAIPQAQIMGSRLSTPEVAHIYASARVVMNSHMPLMAQLGFMSNRSFDALACGASVVSDEVTGFADRALPDLVQAPDREATRAALERLLTRASHASMREAVAASVDEAYGFCARARVLAAEAERLLSTGEVARPAITLSDSPDSPALRRDVSRVVTVSIDDMPGVEDADEGVFELALSSAHGSEVVLRLADPTSTPDGIPPDMAMRRAAGAVTRIARVVSHAPRFASLRVVPPERHACAGLIHGVMPDHRAAQSLALNHDTEDAMADLQHLAERARRMLELDTDTDHPLIFRSIQFDGVRTRLRLLEDRPLFDHSPEGYCRDRHKRHLALWPKNSVTRLKRPVGVFLHLFYPELAAEFRKRLSPLDGRCHVYISTDTPEKAGQIRDAFPAATVSVFPNRGRDVYPKLFGFGAGHDDHDIVLHVHGKKSPHANALDQWLEHCLDCLLPQPSEVERILSLFQTIPRLGILAPVTFRAVLGAAHWADNAACARELMTRMQFDPPLPGDRDLDFPVGSMFWARTAALRPLLDLRLRPESFPPEAGQVDGTPAHAIERLFGVVCRLTGHRLLRMAPQDSNLYRGFRLAARNNGDVRSTLETGQFD